MKKAFLHLIWLLLLVQPSTSNGEEQKPVTAYREAITRAFTAGNDYELYTALETFATTHPERPELWLIIDDLAKLYTIVGHEKVASTLALLAKKIAASHMPSKDLLLLKIAILNDELDYYFRKQTGSAVAEKYQPVREWQCSAVYRKYGTADFNYKFAPELSPTQGEPKWRAIQIKDHAARLYVDRFVAATRGIVYLKKTLIIPARAKLRVEGAAAYRLFVNRVPALSNKREGVFRNQRVLQFAAQGSIELLLKLDLAEQAGIRIMLTDQFDRPLSGSKKSDAAVYTVTEKEYQEVLDYPYSSLKQKAEKGDPDALYDLGWYFSILESREGLPYYQRYIEQAQEVGAKAVMANRMIAYSEREETRDYQQGWAIMRQLWHEYPDCVPVQHYRFRKLLREGKSDEALRFARKIAARAPAYLPLREDLLKHYLEKGYEVEGLREFRALRQKFPFALSVKKIMLDYYDHRTHPQTYEMAVSILEATRDYRVTETIVQYLCDRKRYREAIQYLQEYARDGSVEAMLETARIYLDLARYRQAKKILLRLIAQKEDPLYYYYLGHIEIMRGNDAALYWGKLRALQPLATFPENYLTFTQEGRMGSYFGPYRDKKIVEAAIKKFTEGREFASNVLYRGHFYYIDGTFGTRAFREELIYVKDEEDIEQWGEYAIPFSERKVQLTQARVYHRDGSYSDAYHLHQAGAQFYVTMDNIKKDTLLHLQYEVPYAQRGLYGSVFVQTPLTLLQHYDERIDYAVVKVFAPSEQQVRFYCNREAALKKKEDHDRTQYEIIWKKIPVKEREPFSGEKWRNLLTYDIATFSSNEDFLHWYTGNFPATPGDSLLETAGIDKTMAPEELIPRIYSYVALTVDATGTTAYRPQSPADVIYFSKGRIEDKIFLARAMFEEAGIRAYPALVYKDLPGRKQEFIATHCFTSLLLYLPLDQGQALWLDFSNKYYPAGVVKPEHENKDALIMIGAGHDIKKVHSLYQPATHAHYLGMVRPNGSLSLDARVSFYGAENAIRHYFTDKRYNSENIVSYLDFLRQDLILEGFTVDRSSRKNFKFQANGIMPGFARVGQHTLTFMPFLHELAFLQYVQTTERTMPLVIAQTYDLQNSYTYTLSEKFTDATYAYERTIRWKKGYVAFRIQKQKGEQEMRVVQNIYFPATEVLPAEYGEFLKFCVEMRKENNKRIIIRAGQKP